MKVDLAVLSGLSEYNSERFFLIDVMLHLQEMDSVLRSDNKALKIARSSKNLSSHRTANHRSENHLAANEYPSLQEKIQTESFKHDYMPEKRARRF